MYSKAAFLTTGWNNSLRTGLRYNLACVRLIIFYLLKLVLLKPRDGLAGTFQFKDSVHDH